MTAYLSRTRARREISRTTSSSGASSRGPHQPWRRWSHLANTQSASLTATVISSAAATSRIPSQTKRKKRKRKKKRSLLRRKKKRSLLRRKRRKRKRIGRKKRKRKRFPRRLYVKNDVGAGAAAAIAVAIATAIQAATVEEPTGLGLAAASASRTCPKWSKKKKRCSTKKKRSTFHPSNLRKRSAVAVRATAAQALARIAPEDAWMTAKWKCLRTDSS